MSSLSVSVQVNHLTHDGLIRSYWLTEPPPEHPRPAPLVLCLHGAGGTGEWAMRETGLSELAQREGFFVAYPDALPPRLDRPAKFLTNPQQWNDGAGHGVLGTPSADDVGFLRAVLADLLDRYPIDRHRLYLTGFSNGAAMSFRLAVESPGVFAALAPVAGHCWLAEPRVVPAIPTLYLIGTADPIIPWAGGLVRLPWGGPARHRPPIAQTIARWSRAIGASPTPTPPIHGDGVQIDWHPAQPHGAPLTVCRIAGLGHHWPGGAGILGQRYGGPTTSPIRASEVIWAFFRHPTAEPPAWPTGF
jgi:polyhydroxybutyrate depolymerase